MYRHVNKKYFLTLRIMINAWVVLSGGEIKKQNNGITQGPIKCSAWRKMNILYIGIGTGMCLLLSRIPRFIKNFVLHAWY